MSRDSDIYFYELRLHFFGDCVADCLFCREDDILSLRAMDPTLTELENQSNDAIRDVADAFLETETELQRNGQQEQQT